MSLITSFSSFLELLAVACDVDTLIASSWSNGLERFASEAEEDNMCSALVSPGAGWMLPRGTPWPWEVRLFSLIVPEKIPRMNHVRQRQDLTRIRTFVYDIGECEGSLIASSWSKGW
jgi:hypothetical protein